MATEQQLRQGVVSTIESWVGRKESDGSHRPIIDLYNSHLPRARGYKLTYKDFWCAGTVSAVFIHEKLTDIAPVECSCSKMIELYKKIGRWQENDAYVPEIGDIIMYDWDDDGKGDCTGNPEHVGIVAYVSGNTIKVIEGNIKDAVGYRFMTVNGKNIRGYCLPNYASKATGGAAGGSASKPTSSTTPVKKPATSTKADPARSFDRSFARKYKVTATTLNMRTGANTTKRVIKTLPMGSEVTCYGYYTKIGDTIWLLVKDSKGDVGFCSKKYLK